jgi:hypothetical protein
MGAENWIFGAPGSGMFGVAARWPVRSLAEAAAAGRRFRVATLPMSHVARALEVDETRGFMKAIVDTESAGILAPTPPKAVFFRRARIRWTSRGCGPKAS